MRIFLSNLIWFFSTLPDAVRFWLALSNPEKAQKKAASQRRPTKPEDVILEEPTSGTTGGTKWIPYTEQLRKEFMRAINPWMASIYLRHPGLVFCTHYWSISPYTEVRQPEKGPRRGFAEDREYLGNVRSFLTKALFPVTAAVAGERDPERHLLKTAKALVSSRRLGLISVWHPSALLRLLEFMSCNADVVTSDLRLREALRFRQYMKVWPRLKLISCWDRAFASADAEKVRSFFPGVEVEGKGLLATEGVVSVPWFARRVAAVTSHNLMFEKVDGETREPIEGTRVEIGKLEVGGRYGIVLTTGNGFKNYRLGDVVECTGFVRNTPVIEFCRRSGGTVDLHGEKLHPAFIAEINSELFRRYGSARFSILSPRSDRRGYRLFWECGDGCLPEADVVESLLRSNYHYAYAVDMGQLLPVEVVSVRNGVERWCKLMKIPLSSAKPPVLTSVQTDSLFSTLTPPIGSLGF